MTAFVLLLLLAVGFATAASGVVSSDAAADNHSAVVTIRTTSFSSK
jgi:hypothetical protein